MEQKLKIGKAVSNTIDASGEINITENGTYNIRKYGTANVSVKKGITSDYLTKLLDRSITSAPADLFQGASKVGSYIFSGCNNLESADIPSNILELGYSAFSSCSNLKRVSLPTTLTKINSYCFSYCRGLESIVIPISVETIDDRVFQDCTALTIYCEASSQPSEWNSDWNWLDYNGNTVPVVWGYLSESTTLNDITYHLSQTNLAASPISVSENFSTLKEITIEKNVEHSGKTYAVQQIPAGFVSGNSVVEKLTIPFVGQNVYGSGATHFGYIFGASISGYNGDYVPSSLKEVIITGGTSIGEDAFSRCSSLESIVASNSITTIGDGAFANCSSLTNIEIPDSVTTIGESAFEYCSNLTNVYYGGSIEDWCNINLEYTPMYYASHFYMLDENDEWYEVTNITIPGTVTSIKEYQFRNFKNITSVKISSGVTNIGYGAFYNCDNLTNVTISGSVKNIEGGAFAACDALTSINLPEGLESISGANVFGSALTELTLPSTIKSIAKQAFNYTEFTFITFRGTISQWNSISLDPDWAYHSKIKYVQCSDGQVQL